MERTQLEPSTRRGRGLGMRDAGRRAGGQRRAQHGARGRVAGGRSRDDRGPAVRLVPAGGPLRRSRTGGRALRRGRRRRRRVDDPCPDGVSDERAGPYGERSSTATPTPAEPGASTFHQGLGAEDIATRWGLSRSQLDEFAVGVARTGSGRAGRGPSTRRSCRHRSATGGPRRRGHPARDPVEGLAGAEDAVPGGRLGHRRQRVADLRRRRGAAR